MEKVDTIKAFIRRLVDLQGNLGTKLHELESRHIRMCSSLNNADDEASEAAEEMLREALEVKNDISDLHRTVKTGLAETKCFITDSLRHFDEVLENISKYEDHAAKFGYVPKCKSIGITEKDLDNALNPVSEDDGASKESQDECPDKEIKPTAREPNIMDFGISQSTLKTLGFHLKETAQGSSPPAKKQKEIQDETQDLDADSSVSSIASPILVRKLLKTAPPKLEDSRVEISPGLFVRKPKGSSIEKPSVALPESPKTPELTTVNLKQLMQQVKTDREGKSAEMVGKQGPVTPPMTANLENVQANGQEFKSPEPMVKPGKEDPPSPMTPQTPQLSQMTLELLKNARN